MELYNSIIEKVNGHLGSTVPKKYAYNPDKTWEDVGGNQLIMMKESAYELGGDNKPAVNYACITSDDYVTEDEIWVYGKDLNEINGSVSFARIVLVKVDSLKGEGEEDTEPLFRAIQDIDFVKYHVYPKGYMIRSSSDSFREQVRVSKDVGAERPETALIETTVGRIIFNEHIPQDLQLCQKTAAHISYQDITFLP